MHVDLYRYQNEHEEARRRDVSNANEYLKQILLNGNEIITVSLPDLEPVARIC